MLCPIDRSGGDSQSTCMETVRKCSWSAAGTWHRCSPSSHQLLAAYPGSDLQLYASRFPPANQPMHSSVAQKSAQLIIINPKKQRATHYYWRRRDRNQKRQPQTNPKGKRDARPCPPSAAAGPGDQVKRLAISGRQGEGEGHANTRVEDKAAVIKKHVEGTLCYALLVQHGTSESCRRPARGLAAGAAQPGHSTGGRQKPAHRAEALKSACFWSWDVDWNVSCVCCRFAVPAFTCWRAQETT